MWQLGCGLFPQPRGCGLIEARSKKTVTCELDLLWGEIYEIGHDTCVQHICASEEILRLGSRVCDVWKVLVQGPQTGQDLGK